jgi:predicted nucleic acid-binding protein
MNSNPALFVLDSYALLAYFEGENGAEQVRLVMQNAEREKAVVWMSLINLGEVAYITEREQGLTRAQEVLAAVQQLPIQLFPADQDAVLAAAHINAHHRLSFADAFASAAAQVLQATLLTGNPELHTVEDLIQVQWLT